jgi:O-antigen/teichoic acid export membrane protein
MSEPNTVVRGEPRRRADVDEPGPRGQGRAADSPIALTLVAKAAEALTLVGLATVIPRALGPAHYGVFAVVLAVVGIVSTSLSLGGPVLLSRFVPAAPPAERGALALALALRIARFRAAMVAGAIVLVAILAVVAPARFSATAAVFVGVALVLDVAATLVYQVALALGRPLLWSFRFPLQNTVLVVAALALHAAVGVNGALAAVAIASGTTLAAGLPAVVGLLRAGCRPSRLVPDGALRFGILQGLAGFFVQVALRGNVPLVLLLTADRAEAGFAALGTSIALAATFVVWQVFTVELPRLAARAHDDPGGVEAAATQLARIATLVCTPVALGGVLLADPLLLHVLGERFSGVQDPLVPALATLPFAGLTALATQVAALRVRPDIRIRTTGIGALVFLAVAFVAIPQWGATGGTSAFLAGTVATVLASARELPRVLPRSLLLFSVEGAISVLVLGALR